ncbi:hypothetical protein ACFV4P_35100 [Kitasatospora sp. NPDC059795]|uniref:hypothetical protein n=1 Tax=Kitasatospora sp. NPDC059795 TaxID=3346949 RepID=UPI003664C11C
MQCAVRDDCRTSTYSAPAAARRGTSAGSATAATVAAAVGRAAIGLPGRRPVRAPLTASAGVEAVGDAPAARMPRLERCPLLRAGVVDVDGGDPGWVEIGAGREDQALLRA